MNSRPMRGLDLQPSLFGMGTMRLPVLENGDIDTPAAMHLVRSAIDQGCTYIDTAYGYHNGQSEVLVGKALADGYRERVTLATKLPVWLVKTYADMERLLDEQLARLQLDCVDFYLLHALNGKAFKSMQELNFPKFFDDMIRKGKIRYPAFSFHDDYETFLHIVDAYPFTMAQVQFNLMDVNQQATQEGMLYAAEKMNIVVMEPLRGGSLVKPSEDVQAVYDAFPVQRRPVEWAFRFVANFPQVNVILSGVSTMEQLTDTIQILDGIQPGAMTPEEQALIVQVREAYLKRSAIGCTNCRYCMPCPQGVHIPDIFGAYDEGYRLNNMDGFLGFTVPELRKKQAFADQCVQCGLCEEACPQKIKIIDHLAAIAAMAK